MQVQVRFVTPELEQIDGLACDALVLPVFSDERPLRGVLGLVDWRLCGFLSKLVMGGFLEGAVLETLLVPARPKFGLSQLFVVGLGARAEFDAARFSAAARHMLDTPAKAGARSSVLVLPGRQSAAIPAARAMELLAAVTGPGVDQEELVLLEPGDAQREMQPVLDLERRRARARVP